MKNLFWVSIPFSMLSNLAEAQAYLNSVDCSMQSLQANQGFEVPNNVSLLDDGGVRIFNEDGSSITVSKKTIDLLYKMKLSEIPNFKNSTPCVASSIEK